MQSHKGPGQSHGKLWSWCPSKLYHLEADTWDFDIPASTSQWKQATSPTFPTMGVEEGLS